MSFLGGLGRTLAGGLKGGITGFVGSGFNPMGAIGGAVLGGANGALQKPKKKPGAPSTLSADPMMTPDITGDRNRYLGLLTGGDDAVAKTAAFAAKRALPEFQKTLVGISDSDARRGISNGDTAAGYEANASNDFQNHIADAIAGQSAGLYGAQLGGARDLYGTDLDVQAGNLDRAQAAANAKRQAKSGFWGSLLGAGASLGGAYLANRGGGRRDAGFAGNA